jgi:hypothetical protein
MVQKKTENRHLQIERKLIGNDSREMIGCGGGEKCEVKADAFQAIDGISLFLIPQKLC